MNKAELLKIKQALLDMPVKQRPPNWIGELFKVLRLLAVHHD